jgi:hypothetical protein
MTLVFWAKLGLSLALSVAVVLALLFRPRLERLAQGREDRWFWGSALLLRILPFGLLYVAAGLRAQSDVWMFYVNAVCAREGYFVYRDFENAYAVLFPYLMALPTLLWDSPNAVLLLLIGGEVLTLWYTYRYVGRRRGSRPWFEAFLYLLLPASLVLSILGGQEDYWLWAFTLALMVAAQRPRPAFALGVVAGLALVLSKALFVLLVPTLFVLVRDRLRLLAGMILVGLPVLMVMLKFSGLAFLQPIQQAAEPRTPNLWSLLNPFLNVYETPGVGVLNWVGLVTLLAISVGVPLRMQRRYPFDVTLLVTFLGLYTWLMVIQQSSLANYAFAFLMPVSVWLLPWARRGVVALFLAFNTLVVMQPALWWGLKMPIYQLRDLQVPLFLLEYLLELLLVAGLVAGLAWLYRGYLRRGNSERTV